MFVTGHAKKFKGTNALKRKINPTRVPIAAKESIRWLENIKQSTQRLGDADRCVHITDREGDVYELFWTACDAQTHFLVRTCVDRLADDGQHTVKDLMRQSPVQATHQFELHAPDGRRCPVKLQIKYRRIKVLASVAKQKNYQALSLTVIHARESAKPVDRDRIDWKLLTDLPVTCAAEAIQKLDWYAKRWKIETFHKILKSGCQAEKLKLRTAERLTNLLAIFCILAWRVFWLCMVNRIQPNRSAILVFTPTEMKLLDRLIPTRRPAGRRTVSTYLIRLAKLGGYLDRTRDGPPGNIVLWRGMARLTDIHMGFELAGKVVGN